MSRTSQSKPIMAQKSANGLHQDPPAADAKHSKGQGSKKQKPNSKRQSKKQDQGKTHFEAHELEIIPPTVMGRPTKYDPLFCEQVMALGAQGKSVTQIAALLQAGEHGVGVSKQTLYNWQEEYPDFLDAMTRARELEQAWWEEMGQQGLVMSSFQSSAFAFQMRNRFRDDYRDTKYREQGISDRLANVLEQVNGVTRGLPNGN